MQAEQAATQLGTLEKGDERVVRAVEGNGEEHLPH